MSVFTRDNWRTFDYDKDLVCFIVTNENKQNGDIIINEKPGEYDEKIYNNLNKDVINGEYVDAYLLVPFEFDKIIYKCIIPSGTPFYFSDDLKEISAKKIIIQEPVSLCDIPTHKEVLASGYVDCLRLSLFKGSPKNEIGFFLLNSGNIINPYNYIGNGNDVIAVISNLHDGCATIIALKETSLEWSTLLPDKTRIVTKTPYKDKKVACKDLNGFQNTKSVTKSKRFVYENYPAITYCLNYSCGDYKEGRWFLGSAGDIVSMIRNNMLTINAALSVLQYKGCDCDLLKYDWYWSSSEYHENSVWCVIANSGFLGFNVKSKKGGVRPMTIINYKT